METATTGIPPQTSSQLVTGLKEEDAYPADLGKTGTWLETEGESEKGSWK